MEFTLIFLELFFSAMGLGYPLLLSFFLIITLLGQWVGRMEGWSRFDAFYWSFITALTVGYGDLRPSCRKSKLLALLVAPIVVLQLRLRCPACGEKIGWQAKLMAPDQCKSCGVFLRSKNSSS